MLTPEVLEKYHAARAEQWADPSYGYGIGGAYNALKRARNECSPTRAALDFDFSDARRGGYGRRDKAGEWIGMDPATGCLIVAECYYDTDSSVNDDDCGGDYTDSPSGRSSLTLKRGGEWYRTSNNDDAGYRSDDAYFTPKAWARGDTAAYLKAHGMSKHAADCADFATLIRHWQRVEDYYADRLHYYGLHVRIYASGTDPDTLTDKNAPEPLADDACWGYEGESMSSPYILEAAAEMIDGALSTAAEEMERMEYGARCPD